MFLKYFANFINVFGKGYKIKIVLSSIFAFIMGIVEFSGLCLIFPFMLLVTQKEVFLSSKTASFVFKNLTFINENNIIPFFAVAIISIYILKNIMMIFCVKYQNNVISHWLMNIYRNTLEKLIYAPYEISSKLNVGEKYSLLNTVIVSALWGFMHKCILLISSALIALCILMYLFYKFTIPALITALFLGACLLVQHSFFKARAKLLGSQMLEAGKISQEELYYIVHSIKEIKISKNKNYFIDKLAGLYNIYNKISTTSNSNGIYPLYTTEVIIVISFVMLVSLMFLLQDIEQSVMVSSVAVVCAVILRLVPVLNKIQSSMYSINTSKSSLVWFMDTYRILCDKSDNFSTKETIEFNNTVTLKNISFKYKGEFELKNINLQIQKGDFIGIVGTSGAGKTTLVDIITGLYKPAAGEICIDNKKLSKDNLYSWQEKIALLPQEFSLVPDSVLKNVAWGVGDSDIDINKVIVSLKQAKIYNEISDLYKKPELSVGQKHRLVLARALYKDAEVIFLDEATSSLDIKTEDEVSSFVASLKGKKTIIAIAHRLSTLKECDKIIYMDKGEIIDIGSFKELKERHENFENMLKLSSFEPV